MTLIPSTKFDKENAAMSKTIDDNIMQETYDVNFLIFNMFGTIPESDSRSMVLKFTFLLITLYTIKN